MPTVLITGASRGIGLEFCKQYGEEGWVVYACCRSPSRAKALNQLANDYEKLKIEPLDLSSFEQIDSLACKLSGIKIDVLINNAGVYDDNRGNGFGRLDYEMWLHSLTVNTLAPVKMAEAFLKHISQSSTKLIVNISSLMGSISDNGSGGSLLYRSSKAALNAAMKSIALDFQAQGVGVLILHPGWVKTDMGGANALIDAQASVAGMRRVINQFTLAQTGSFIRYDGKSLPW